MSARRRARRARLRVQSSAATGYSYKTPSALDELRGLPCGRRVTPEPQRVGEEGAAERGERRRRDEGAQRRSDDRRDGEDQSDDLHDADRLTPAAWRQRTLQPRPEPARGHEQISQQSRDDHPRPGLAELD